MMADRLFYVTMEYLPEARHNPGFKADLVPVVRDFHAGLDAVWTALASRTGADPDHTRVVMNATMCLVRGMISQTVLRNDPPYYAAMLRFWKRRFGSNFLRVPRMTRSSPGAVSQDRGRDRIAPMSAR